MVGEINYQQQTHLKTKYFYIKHVSCEVYL